MYSYIFDSKLNKSLLSNLQQFKICNPFFKDMPEVNERLMLWFNFILGLNFITLCFKLIIIHYHTQKQRKQNLSRG